MTVDRYLFRLPLVRRSPYLALHFERRGTEIHRGYSRPLYRVGLMGGIMFSDGGWQWWRTFRGRWQPPASSHESSDD